MGFTIVSPAIARPNRPDRVTALSHQFPVVVEPGVGQAGAGPGAAIAAGVQHKRDPRRSGALGIYMAVTDQQGVSRIGLQQIQRQ